MAYTKQVWVDNDTSKPVSAARLSHIEDGIAALDSALPSYALKTEVPALGEDCVSVPLMWPGEASPLIRTATGGPTLPNCPLLSLPFGVQILSAEFMFDNACAASATDYYSMSLLRVHPTDVTVTMATYTTQTVAITGRNPWDANPTYDPANRLLTADHGLYINCARVGTPPATLNYGLITVRYSRT
jgi:hypothetical protein